MPDSSSQPPLLALRDAVLFTGEAMVEGHALIIRDGKVADIVANSKIPSGAVTASLANHILAPGFIDVQVNGGGNRLFNAEPDAATAGAIAAAHFKYGTTRLLVTCITDAPDVTRKAIDAVRAARRDCPNILGIHIEGPHLSAEKRGVHNKDMIRALTADDVALYQPKNGEVVLLTVAPEAVPPQQIADLAAAGILVSLGHSNAQAEQVRAALAAGATGFTHLYNGMSGLSGRDPGVAGVAIDDEGSWCGIILDNHHVGAEMARIAIRAKPQGKMMLVSDAMPSAATDTPQPFTLYGEAIRLENGRCVNGEGRLAGSAITMSDAVKNCLTLGIEAGEALRMASAYPAAFLGMDDRFGKLLPGYSADIVALDYSFNPRRSWLGQ